MKSGLKEGFQKLLGIVIGIALIGFLINWGMNRDENHRSEYPWIGSVFLGQEYSQEIVDSKEFKTIEDCRQWATKTIEEDSFRDKDKLDYSCGTDCQFGDDIIVSGKRIKQYECGEVTK